MDKTRLCLLVLILMGVSFSARADWGPGPPAYAFYGMWTLGLIAGFLLCMLIAYGFKTFIESFTKTKRKHTWFQSTCMFIFTCAFLYAEEEYNLLYSFEGKYGYEAKEQFYRAVIITCFIGGCIVGYLITPRKKVLD